MNATTLRFSMAQCVAGFAIGVHKRGISSGIQQCFDDLRPHLLLSEKRSVQRSVLCFVSTVDVRAISEYILKNFEPSCLCAPMQRTTNAVLKIDFDPSLEKKMEHLRSILDDSLGYSTNMIRFTWSMVHDGA